MARYTGPKSRIARKFGEAIFGADKVLSKKNYPPGRHGHIQLADNDTLSKPSALASTLSIAMRLHNFAITELKATTGLSPTTCNDKASF